MSKDINKERPSIGVVGGGMLGLTLALRLTQAGYRVTVIEAASKLGGLVSSWQLGSISWDRYYHVIMLSDLRLRSLLEELAIEALIEWRVTKTNFYTGQDLYPLNNAWDYIRLPALTLIDKVRLAATIVYGSRIKKGKKLEAISAEKWLTQLSGKSTYQNLWRPLLRSKLGSNYSKASAAYIWSVIRRFYAARRGGMKTEMFGYVPGGYQKVLSVLEQRALSEGVIIKTGMRVSSITKDINELTVDSKEDSLKFDRIIDTCASPIAVDHCKALSEDEIKAHSQILYQGIICASLILTRPLGKAYLTYITDETIPFTTIIEMSTLVDSAVEFNGKHLVYLPKYLPVDDPLFAAADEVIEARFIAGLVRMFPDLKRSEILAFKISRTRHVVAVATQNYTSKLPSMATSVPGLYIINSAHIVNASLSVDETVNLANTGAEFFLAQEAGV